MYIQQLEDKKPSDLSSKGKIVNLNIIENDEWLLFKVDWITEDSSICHNHEILKIKIVDAEWRKFIAGYIAENKGNFMKHNLLSQILDRRLPIFDNQDEKKNMQLIKRQMKPYVLAQQKSSELFESIEAEQDKLDSLVFELYSRDEKDIELLLSKS